MENKSTTVKKPLSEFSDCMYDKMVKMWDVMLLTLFPFVKRRKVFHGNCLNCITPIEGGIGKCLGCQCFNLDTSKPNLFKKDPEIDKERESLMQWAKDNPDAKVRKVFHGGCLRCVTPTEQGIGTCIGCQYFNANWDKPNLFKEDPKVVAEREGELQWVKDHPDAKERKIFHGSCHGCVTPTEEGIGACLGCKYVDMANTWKLPSLRNVPETCLS